MSFSVEPPKLNELLKLHRERKRTTLQMVHQDTRIAVAYLEALEAGDYAKFPAEVYCIGFLKKYAAYLGMNPDEAAAQYKKEQESVHAEKKKEEVGRQVTEKHEKSSDMAKVLTLTFLLVVIAGWWLYSVVSHSSARKHREPAAIVQRGMAPVSPEPNKNLTLVAHAKYSVWMKIMPDKKLSFEGFVAAGSSRTWEAQDEIYVRIGNVEAVELALNGAPVDVRAGSAQQVNEMVLTRKSLEEKPAPAPPAPPPPQ